MNNYDCLNDLAAYVHASNKNWWTDLETGETLERNFGELVVLIITELVEALEGHRKDLMDDHLPKRKMVEVELADALIRLLDLCGGMRYDLAGAFAEKMAYNSERADHKIENRREEGGKRY